jgi:hypothetical protein
VDDGVGCSPVRRTTTLPRLWPLSTWRCASTMSVRS